MLPSSFSLSGCPCPSTTQQSSRHKWLWRHEWLWKVSSLSCWSWPAGAEQEKLLHNSPHPDLLGWPLLPNPHLHSQLGNAVFKYLRHALLFCLHFIFGFYLLNVHTAPPVPTPLPLVLAGDHLRVLWQTGTPRSCGTFIFHSHPLTNWWYRHEAAVQQLLHFQEEDLTAVRLPQHLTIFPFVKKVERWGKYRVKFFLALMLKSFSAVSGKKKKEKEEVYCSLCFTLFKSGIYHLESQTSIHFCGFAMAAAPLTA